MTLIISINFFIRLGPLLVGSLANVYNVPVNASVNANLSTLYPRYKRHLKYATGCASHIDVLRLDPMCALSNRNWRGGGQKSALAGRARR
jgi:hypothetical protein